MPFYKPVIVMSKCLFNINNQISAMIEKMQKCSTIIPICPLKDCLMKKEDYYIELTDEFHLVSRKDRKKYSANIDDSINDLLKNNYHVTAFILKSDSNVCGLKNINIYDKKGRLKERSEGLLIYKLRSNILSLFYEEDVFYDELRMENLFTKIYCLSDLDNIINEGSYHRLIDFHNRNKFVLGLYDNHAYQNLSLLINSENERVFSLYEEGLIKLFERDFTKTDFKRICLEIMDHYLDYTNLKERQFIKELYDDYDNNLLSSMILEYILRNNVFRFNLEKDMEQTFFNRYPKYYRSLIYK